MFHCHLFATVCLATVTESIPIHLRDAAGGEERFAKGIIRVAIVMPVIFSAVIAIHFFTTPDPELLLALFTR
jgi:hypothetical protein